jgi:hypothetical protein
MIGVAVDRRDASDLGAARAAELGASATKERFEADANIGAVRPSFSIQNSLRSRSASSTCFALQPSHGPYTSRQPRECVSEINRLRLSKAGNS